MLKYITQIKKTVFATVTNTLNMSANIAASTFSKTHRILYNYLLIGV